MKKINEKFCDKNTNGIRFIPGTRNRLRIVKKAIKHTSKKEIVEVSSSFFSRVGAFFASMGGK